jgi:hypothetical protein
MPDVLCCIWWRALWDLRGGTQADAALNSAAVPRPRQRAGDSRGSIRPSVIDPTRVVARHDKPRHIAVTMRA